MKIELLQKVIRSYMTSEDCLENEYQELFEALDNCAATLDRYENSDVWQNEISFVPVGALYDLLHTVTYDIYGKLARIHNGKVPFDYYAWDCRKDVDLRQLTDDQLEPVYDIIRDLWSDNEAMGDNNPDGTFKQ